MPNLRNGSKGGSNPGSLHCESGILQLSYRAPPYYMYRPIVSLYLVVHNTILCIAFCMHFQIVILCTRTLFERGRPDWRSGKCFFTSGIFSTRKARLLIDECLIPVVYIEA